MHAGDGLATILQAIKADLPGVPDETWERLERSLRSDMGGRDHFIAKRAKRNRIQALQDAIQADSNASNAELAQRLNISISRVQQLKRLCRP